MTLDCSDYIVLCGFHVFVGRWMSIHIVLLRYISQINVSFELCYDGKNRKRRNYNPVTISVIFVSMQWNPSELLFKGYWYSGIDVFEANCSWNWWLPNYAILCACRRELHEELGIILPKDAFELIFIFLQEWLVDQTLVYLVESIHFLFFYHFLA